MGVKSSREPRATLILSAPEIVARLGVHPDRPERWAIIGADGKPMWWGRRLTEMTRTQIAIELAPGLAAHGLILLEDNTIIRTTDLADAAIETVRDAIAKADTA